MSTQDLFTEAERTALVALRREIHRFPELSWKEHETAGRLEAALRQLGVKDVTRIAGTGLVARVPGRTRGAAVIALRGDIDALPIEEATGLPYTSERPGVMHACGHDVHATWAVAAAVLLSHKPAAGDVLVVLQPAEEVGEGARAVLASGALDDAKVIFGAHVDRRFAVGEVVADAGPLAASADQFEIVLTGRGAHGARPHESADPIVGAGALIGALQTIVSRRLAPAFPAVLTIATVHSGTASNIIPETATLTGTIRTTDAESRALLVGELRRITEQIAAVYRLSAAVTLPEGLPALVNATDAATWAHDAATRVLGPNGVVPLGMTNMASEDFACYLERIPGAFLRVGAREPGGERHAAHAPRFYAAEPSIFIGAAVLAESARISSDAITARERA